MFSLPLIILLFKYLLLPVLSLALPEHPLPLCLVRLYWWFHNDLQVYLLQKVFCKLHYLPPPDMLRCPRLYLPRPYAFMTLSVLL